MAPVSRRSFLAGVIAAPIVAAVAPKVREGVSMMFASDGNRTVSYGEWSVDAYKRMLADAQTRPNLRYWVEQGAWMTDAEYRALLSRRWIVG
jgi:hypothetical protein